MLQTLQMDDLAKMSMITVHNGNRNCIGTKLVFIPKMTDTELDMPM